MHFIQLGKLGQDLRESVVVVLLRVFDFARVKLTYTAYAVLLVDHGRCFTLCFRQCSINEILFGTKQLKNLQNLRCDF